MDGQYQVTYGALLLHKPESKLFYHLVEQGVMEAEHDHPPFEGVVVYVEDIPGNVGLPLTLPLSNGMEATILKWEKQPLFDIVWKKWKDQDLARQADPDHKSPSYRPKEHVAPDKTLVLMLGDRVFCNLVSTLLLQDIESLHELLARILFELGMREYEDSEKKSSFFHGFMYSSTQRHKWTIEVVRYINERNGSFMVQRPVAKIMSEEELMTRIGGDTEG